MKFLSLSDRKEAALVNKLWYEASLHPVLQSDMIVVLSSNQRRFHGVNVHICSLSDSLVSVETVERNDNFCQGLRYLSFKGCDMDEHICCKLLKKCENLVELDLGCCNTAFMSGNFMKSSEDKGDLKSALCKVRTLSLSSIRYLSNTSFLNVMSVCDNVTKLSLASISLTFHETPYGRQYNKAKDNNIITFSCVLQYVTEKAHLLTCLNLSRTGVNDGALVSLSAVSGLELREIILVQCRDITDEGVKILCKNQVKIKHLDLSLCQNLGNTMILSIGYYLHQLEVLKVPMCKLITDAGITHLNSISTLRQLVVSELYNLTSCALSRALCASGGLSHLNVMFCSSLDDQFVLTLSTQCRFLTHLNLTAVPITDVGCHMITRCLKSLEFLKVSRCHITDVGLLGYKYVTTAVPQRSSSSSCEINEGSSSAASNPTPTNCGDHNSSTDIKSVDPNKSPVNLLNLSHLRHLDLSHCTQLTDTSIAQVIMFRELQSVDLTSLDKITGESLQTIASNNPSLENVAISKCIQITDSGIEMLARGLKRLTSLDMSRLSKVTNSSVRCIAQYCTRLRTLDISCCDNITMDAALELNERLTSLTSVNMKFIGSGAQ